MTQKKTNKTTTNKVTKAAPKKTAKPVIKEEDIPVYEITEVESIEVINEAEQELKMEGLGDLVKKVTNFLGLETCGKCEERRKAYNNQFKWLKPQRYFTEDEITYLEEIESTKQVKDPKRFFKLYNEMFKDRVEVCHCPGLVGKMVRRLVDWKDEQINILNDNK